MKLTAGFRSRNLAPFRFLPLSSLPSYCSLRRRGRVGRRTVYNQLRGARGIGERSHSFPEHKVSPGAFPESTVACLNGHHVSHCFHVRQKQPDVIS